MSYDQSSILNDTSNIIKESKFNSKHFPNSIYKSKNKEAIVNTVILALMVILFLKFRKSS